MDSAHGYVRTQSPFYRQKFRTVGAVRSLVDLGSLPLTSGMLRPRTVFSMRAVMSSA